MDDAGRRRDWSLCDRIVLGPARGGRTIFVSAVAAVANAVIDAVGRDLHLLVARVLAVEDAVLARGRARLVAAVRAVAVVVVDLLTIQFRGPQRKGVTKRQKVVGVGVEENPRNEDRGCGCVAERSGWCMRLRLRHS